MSAPLAAGSKLILAERMKRESLDARLEHLIHHDWAEVVEGMIHNGTAEGYARPDSDWNVSGTLEVSVLIVDEGRVFAIGVSIDQGAFAIRKGIRF